MFNNSSLNFVSFVNSNNAEILDSRIVNDSRIVITVEYTVTITSPHAYSAACVQVTQKARLLLGDKPRTRQHIELVSNLPGCVGELLETLFQEYSLIQILGEEMGEEMAKEEVVEETSDGVKRLFWGPRGPTERQARSRSMDRAKARRSSTQFFMTA